MILPISAPRFATRLRLPSSGRCGRDVVHPLQREALFAGYFRDPVSTANALRYGALWTGDLGRLDAVGNMAFLGRMTDRLRCRGEKCLGPGSSERVAHPDVEDCAVIGVAAEIG